MKKYICSVNLSQIIVADSKDQACEIFIENHDFEDLYPDCKEFRKKKKLWQKMDEIGIFEKEKHEKDK